jgi:hypothetical protein
MEYAFSLKVYNRRIRNKKTGEQVETKDAQIVLIAPYLKPLVGQKVNGTLIIPDQPASVTQ